MEEEARLGKNMAINAYGTPLTLLTSFNYLGRDLSAEDDDWPEVVHNIWRAHQKWAQLTRVFSREGADARNSGPIYLAMVQLVMIYGSEKWVMTLCMGRILGGFHHRVSCRLIGTQLRRGRDGVWVYLPLEYVTA